MPELTLDDFRRYSSVIFDCDGVLLDSNRLKTEAFAMTASVFGKEAAEALVAFHIANGGVSRQHKFRFLAEWLGIHDNDGSWVAGCCDRFAAQVECSLLNCPAAERLPALRSAVPSEQQWFIVSGGAEAELRRVFEMRGLSALFGGGVFGNPRTKDEILAALDEAGQLRRPALYLGDSHYDVEVSRRFGLDAVFVYGWTEFDDWRTLCREQRLPALRAIDDLVKNDGSAVPHGIEKA